MLLFIARNLLRNRRRTLLTFLSVAAATLLLGVLLSVYAAFYLREGYDEQAVRLITRHKVSYLLQLPRYYGDRIAEIPGVEETCIFDYFQGTYIDNRAENMFPRSAVEAEKVFRIRTESIVEPDELQAFLSDRQGMAVGRSIAERVGLDLGDRVVLIGDIYPVTLELYVRAIYSGPDDIEAYFHYEYLQEALPDSLRDRAMMYSVRVKTPEDAPRVAEAVDEMFRNSPEPTKTETEKAFLLAYIGSIGNIKAFLTSLAGAVVFTLMLVTGNAMAMTVRERARETAVLRTLGFSRLRVLVLITGEALTVSAAGGVLGTLLTLALGGFLANQTVSFLQGFAMPGWGAPVSVAAAAILGVTAAAPAALGAVAGEITAGLGKSD